MYGSSLCCSVSSSSSEPSSLHHSFSKAAWRCESTCDSAACSAAAGASAADGASAGADSCASGGGLSDARRSSPSGGGAKRAGCFLLRRVRWRREARRLREFFFNFGKAAWSGSGSSSVDPSSIDWASSSAAASFLGAAIEGDESPPKSGAQPSALQKMGAAVPRCAASCKRSDSRWCAGSVGGAATRRWSCVRWCSCTKASVIRTTASKGLQRSFVWRTGRCPSAFGSSAFSAAGSASRGTGAASGTGSGSLKRAFGCKLAGALGSSLGSFGDGAFKGSFTTAFTTTGVFATAGALTTAGFTTTAAFGVTAVFGGSLCATLASALDSSLNGSLNGVFAGVFASLDGVAGGSLGGVETSLAAKVAGVAGAGLAFALSRLFAASRHLPKVTSSSPLVLATQKRWIHRGIGISTAKTHL
mmetsp:Transcript_12354/g.42752  ORF Transcript_12354/g.42752 Transcript_12354/m.42752 type:complete len:417 (+) Transcript_12354:55-1305(+)